MEFRWENLNGIFLHSISPPSHSSCSPYASVASVCSPQVSSGHSSKLKHNPARRKSKPPQLWVFLAVFSSLEPAHTTVPKSAQGLQSSIWGNQSLIPPCWLPWLTGSIVHRSIPLRWLKQERICPSALWQSLQVAVNPAHAFWARAEVPRAAGIVPQGWILTGHRGAAFARAGASFCTLLTEHLQSSPLPRSTHK